MNPQQPAPVSFNSSGSGAKSAITTMVLVLLLVIALVFAGWAFLKGQDYKNNSDKKVAAAVDAAKKAQATQLQAQFDQDSKSPSKTFRGSATYGSVSFDYPKTYNAYVDSTNSSEPINAYFFPDQVPSIQSGVAYALRVELVSTDYAQIVQQLTGQIKKNNYVAQAFLPVKLKDAANVQPGTMFSNQDGELLVIKLRDKTLEISTQSADYLADFNNIVLPSLNFVP